MKDVMEYVGKNKENLIMMPIIAGLCYIGVVKDVPLYFDIFTFYSVISIAFVMIAIRNKDIYAKLLISYQDDRHLPVSIDIAWYFGIALFLAYTGHWFLSMIWTFKGSIDLYYRRKSNKLIKPLKKVLERIAKEKK